MPPETIYFLALAVLVAPSMLINRMAVLLGGVWAVQQSVFLLGLDWRLFDFAIDTLALFAAMFVAASSHKWSDLLTGLIFAPMLALHAGGLIGWVHPYYAWWAIYYLALFQIGSMLSGNDWGNLSKLLRFVRTEGATT